MNRVPVLLTFLIALSMLGVTAGLVGCSHGDGGTQVTTPGLTADASMPTSPLGDGMNLGYFQFVWDDNGMVTVEQAGPPRGADINVTNYASIVIEDFFFNEEHRNWYITATLRNISPYTGYDVWAVFHSLGNKFVINQDGYIWALPPIFPEPTRCAFIAYGKNNENRVFPPMTQDTRTIVIHQPEGIPKLAPLGFWIDATAHPRTTPGIEDLEVTTDDGTNYHMTGFVWDHQSPSSDLTVWADCTNFNQNPYVAMYDDGQHGDGAAGDDIFGGDFAGDPPDGPYVVTVYAFDPQGNQGENDARFWHGEDIPCDLPIEHFPFETIDKGEMSGINYERFEVVNDWHTWETLWTEHMSNQFPAPPPPPIDFEMNSVIGVWIGARPTNNHIATIVDVAFDPCENLMTVLYEYTPYVGCGMLDVMTSPFHIVITPKFGFDTYFSGIEVDCPAPPPDCVEEIPFETLIQGMHSSIKEPYEQHVTNMDQFELLWEMHTLNQYPPPPMPDVNFEHFDLIAVGIGERPTSGFDCIIDRICWLPDEAVGVFYRERIPGPECPVEMVFTQPFHWVLVPKVEAPMNFFKLDEFYNCGPEDCAEPQMFWPIDEGSQTGHEAGNFVFHGPDQFEAFWSVHKPGHPVPPVDWENMMVAAMLIGGRPSTGYFVTTEEVCLNGFNDPGGEIHMDIRYTENIPGPDCIVLWIGTHPFQIIVVPKFDGPVFFEYHENVYDCPPCEPTPWYQLADGGWSCLEQGDYGYPGFNDDFYEGWHKLHCDEQVPVPEIPEPINPGWEMKPFIVQLGLRPTSGYYVTIDNVCIDGCQVFVDYTVWIPGPDCEVFPEEFKPWAMGVAEFPPVDCVFTWNFNGHEEIYNCSDCYPVPYYPIAGGFKSCAEAGEYGFQYEEGYMAFWKQINCWEEGDPLPPLPQDPPPSGDNIMYHFGIQLPERPSTGYIITVEEVCIEGCDVYIKWTENIPGNSCEVEWVETKPWLIVAVELPPVYCYWTWHFEKTESVYECPDDPCFDFETIAGSNFHGPEQPGGWYFDNFPAFHEYWSIYHSGQPVPDIKWDSGWGAYAIHLGMRPTTGYELGVFEICPSDDPFGVAVRWMEWIPGPTCNVQDILTFPWTLVTFPLVDMPYYDEGFEEVYICD